MVSILVLLVLVDSKQPLLLVVAFFVPALVVVVVYVVVALEMVLIVLLLGLVCLVPHQNLLDLYGSRGKRKVVEVHQEWMRRDVLVNWRSK